jgi:hypothetical protein
MIFMPVLVLFTEKFFDYFILALAYPPLLFSIGMLVYFKKYISSAFTSKSLKNTFLLLLLINGLNNFIICLSGGILGSILGMAHYDSPNITIFTHISFAIWFISIFAILFATLLYLFVKPFIEYLDSSIRKIKKEKQNEY